MRRTRFYISVKELKPIDRTLATISLRLMRRKSKEIKIETKNKCSFCYFRKTNGQSVNEKSKCFGIVIATIKANLQ